MEFNEDKITVTEATLLQKELRNRIITQPIDPDIKIIGGADISFNRFSPIVYAGIILLSYPGLELISESTIITTVNFPYIPGYLAFREVPALLKAWEQLTVKPDVLIVDGHGIAHPRRMGIATHFGVLADVPTIGSAKNVLFGKYEAPGITAGNATELKDKNEVLGYAYRSKSNVKPIFVSPGYKADLPGSLSLIKTCIRKHRLPEPTRLAHNAVNAFRISCMGNEAEVLQ